MSRRSAGRPKTEGVLDAAFIRAAKNVVERLESRCLLSMVTAFPIPGQSAENFSWNGSAHIVAGPDGNLWFTDPGNNQVDRVTPQGQITPFALPVHNVTSTGGGGSTANGGPITDPILTPDDPSPDGPSRN